MRNFDIVVARALRANAKRFRSTYPRSNESWKIAEDRRLLRLHAKYKRKFPSLGLRLWLAISDDMKRTPSALQTRFAALLAGQRLCRVR